MYKLYTKALVIKLKLDCRETEKISYLLHAAYPKLKEHENLQSSIDLILDYCQTQDLINYCTQYQITTLEFTKESKKEPLAVISYQTVEAALLHVREKNKFRIAVNFLDHQLKQGTACTSHDFIKVFFGLLQDEIDQRAKKNLVEELLYSKGFDYTDLLGHLKLINENIEQILGANLDAYFLITQNFNY